MEKLLRSCPDIKNIYLLMRPKRGQEVAARLNELLNSPVSVIHKLTSPNSSYNQWQFVVSFLLHSIWNFYFFELEFVRICAAFRYNSQRTTD